MTTVTYLAEMSWMAVWDPKVFNLFEHIITFYNSAKDSVLPI